MAESEPRVYNIHEAKTHLSKLLERVEKGEELVIARAGMPVARLTAVPSEKPNRKPGAFRGILIPGSFFDPMTGEELAEWYK